MNLSTPRAAVSLLLMLFAVGAWADTSEGPHGQEPELGSFFAVPLHGKYVESFYDTDLRLCEYTNGYLTGRYGGPMQNGTDSGVRGYMRGYRTVSKAAGTWTEFYPDTQTTDSGAWWGDIDEDGAFFNGSASDDLFPGVTSWTFTRLSACQQSFCPEDIDYRFPLVVPPAFP